MTLRTGQGSNIERVLVAVPLPVSLASYSVTATISTASAPAAYEPCFDVGVLVASKSRSSFGLELIRGYNSFLPSDGIWTVDVNVIGIAS